MAGEIIYADLHIPAGPSSSRSHHPTALSQIPRWHKIALWIGWVGNVILVVTVIILGVWVSRTTSEREEKGIDSQQDCGSRTDTSAGEGGSRPDAFRSQLRESLCLQKQSDGAEGSRCKLCPGNWLQNGSKCYWVTRETKTWHASRDDCSAKKSQLVMIQDLEEMEYIKGITPGSSSVWIGLSATASGKEWIWLNGSQFDQTRLLMSQPAKANFCGMMRRSKIASERCSTEYPWVCQKDAIPI